MLKRKNKIISMMILFIAIVAITIIILIKSEKVIAVDTYCPECNQPLTEVKAATCTQKGQVKCENCGYSGETSALGHTSHVTGEKCTRCGQTHTAVYAGRYSIRSCFKMWFRRMLLDRARITPKG